MIRKWKNRVTKFEVVLSFIRVPKIDRDLFVSVKLVMIVKSEFRLFKSYMQEVSLAFALPIRDCRVLFVRRDAASNELAA